jgi:hypothetical protein
MTQPRIIVHAVPIVLLSLFLPLAAAPDQQTTKDSTTASDLRKTRSAHPKATTDSDVVVPAQSKIVSSVAGPDTSAGCFVHAISPATAPSVSNGAVSVEKLRAEAARLKAEARSLRELADTLNRSSNDAEKRADEAQEKAQKLSDEIAEQDVRHEAGHIRIEIERAKRLIQADIERIKSAHGVASADDSLYEHQADSLDTALSRMSKDTTGDVERRKKLVQEIQDNSGELLKKSREMSSKARELEESADKRDDLAEDLSEKANKLAEDRNPVSLSMRFPLHFGFQLRLTDVGPYNEQKLDLLLLHGMFLTYSFTKHIDAGLQDITLYWEDTPLGERFAINAAPSVQIGFFPVKRFQLGAVAGVSVQGRVGAAQPAKASIAPYIELFNQVWVRNHFSISPLIRLNYAAYGPYYTAALSQHSGVLPQGAAWLDVGISYGFNF